VRVACVVQEHNIMSLVRAQTWTAKSGGEYTNNEANSKYYASTQLTVPMTTCNETNRGQYNTQYAKKTKVILSSPKWFS